MEDVITLEAIYKHPLVEELVNENATLKKQIQMSDKPNVEDINNISLPYTVKNHLLIDQGEHNDIIYNAQILRMAVKQHDGLSIFLDHHDNNSGGTVETWVGEIKNPTWSEEKHGIVGDIDIVDPKSAMAIAYGAKWGISATVDIDQQANLDGGADIATDPKFKSYSLVIDPAVRGTMLNEESKKEENKKEEMTEELKLKDDIKPALATLEDAIKRATAKRDNDMLVPLRQTKAILIKLSGSTYPYPGKGLEGKTMEEEELEKRFDMLEQSILSLKPAELEEKSDEVKQLEAENKRMTDELKEIHTARLTAYSEIIVTKELELGLIWKDDAEKRRKELETLDEKTLRAIEENLDKTIQILESEEKKELEDKDKEPESRELLERKGKKKDDTDYDRKLLDLMIGKQGAGKMELGGY